MEASTYCCGHVSALPVFNHHLAALLVSPPTDAGMDVHAAPHALPCSGSVCAHTQTCRVFCRRVCGPVGVLLLSELLCIAVSLMAPVRAVDLSRVICWHHFMLPALVITQLNAHAAGSASWYCWFQVLAPCFFAPTTCVVDRRRYARSRSFRAPGLRLPTFATRVSGSVYTV